MLEQDKTDSRKRAQEKAQETKYTCRDTLVCTETENQKPLIGT